MATTP
jgi:hypothetical protein